MKKRLIISFALVAVFIFVMGCKHYDILKETNPNRDLKDYKKIHIGWIDLGEDRWSMYGYKSKAEWTSIIAKVNISNFPSHVKSYLSDKSLFFSKRKAEKAPAACDLIVKFTDVNYVQKTNAAAKIMFGSFAGSDTLKMTILFIDAKTKKILDQANISIDSEARTGYSSISFEGRINNTVYNAASFLADKLN